VFGRSAEGHAALHTDDGSLKSSGSNIIVPHLADSLEIIATEGSRAFYEGELGTAIAGHCADNGGLLTLDDLSNYEPIVRAPLMVRLARWQVASNPPPAVGGAILSAMLLAFEKNPIVAWDSAALRQLINVQRAVLSFRKKRLDLSDDIAADVAELIDIAANADRLSVWASSSTVHTSTADDSGMACAITASSGYGSGEMPVGTGLWLNNSLGELELNRRGLKAGPTGARLPSNMAPGVARCGDKVLAMGSPGADRITTALHQFLVNFMQLGLPLRDAIAHPRVHLELGENAENLAVEPGIELPDLALSVTRYPEIGMYFGGVGAVLFDRRTGFELGADPRREGGTCIAGA
jgi:gamma-glutamyltranspeptidase/glutathione hydrolase